MAKHVEVGLGSRQTARHRRQDDDVGLGFSRQQLRQSLAELNLGGDNPDILLSYLVDERLQVEGRWLCTRLHLNRADNVKVESLCQIGPSWMMGDETPVG